MRKRDRMRSGSVVWRTNFGYPYANIGLDGKQVIIALFDGKDTHGDVIIVSRRLARMLTKRINQALDASK